MPDLEPSRLHADALLALAETGLAALGSALTCYLDAVPDDPAWPYVVFWSTPATPAAAAVRLRGWAQEVETVTQATVAGLSVLDVLGAADRLALAVHRRRPVIVGRQCGDVEVELATARPVLDPNPTPEGRPVWTAVLFFRFMSNPTTSIGA
ncbi:hypothetical protein [Micromonospora sp. RP3T]|uniref:hypothetical protein n=1 Tax=Micromonospora sp. RP3T TaxID=2135446 RepID=UPI003D712C0B